MAKRKKKKGGSKAISINVAKWAVALGTLGICLQGMSLQDFTNLGGLTKPLENFKSNWTTIVPAAVGVSLLGRMLGKWAPRAGIKGALSVKAF